MKTMFKTTFPVLLMLTLSSGLVFGQGAEKATAATSDTSFAVSTNESILRPGPFPLCTNSFFDAIKVSIKPPAGQSDLLVTFSALTTLATESHNVDASTSSAIATSTNQNTSIEVKLQVDGKDAPFAFPSFFIVPLDNLIRGTSLTINPPLDTFTLVQGLRQGGVRSLTWAVPSVGHGEHEVKVQARCTFQTSASGSEPVAVVLAILGPRTLVVEGVNIKTN